MKNFMLSLMLLLSVGCSSSDSTPGDLKKEVDCDLIENAQHESCLEEPEVEKDADKDGVNDDIDNCLGKKNPSQSDEDNDGIGDACDSINGNNIPEICDGLDNNGNGEIDEGLSKKTYYLDSDGDGYGVSNIFQTSCVAVVGYSEQKGDCDDRNKLINPGVSDIPGNGVNENCDDKVDGTISCTSASDKNFDLDGDGIASMETCPEFGKDCNDSPGFHYVYPDALEICGDFQDTNCNGTVDEDCYDPASNEKDPDSFNQLKAGEERPIDILIVMDTSGSMYDDRDSVVKEISYLIDGFSWLDWRIAVLYGHAGSLYTGKLHGDEVNNTPFQYKDVLTKANFDANPEQFTIQFNEMMTGTTNANETLCDGGECGLYSLHRAVSTNFEENRATGKFFRKDAILSVILVSDENDFSICAPNPWNFTGCEFNMAYAQQTTEKFYVPPTELANFQEDQPLFGAPEKMLLTVNAIYSELMYRYTNGDIAGLEVFSIGYTLPKQYDSQLNGQLTGPSSWGEEFYWGGHHLTLLTQGHSFFEINSMMTKESVDYTPTAYESSNMHIGDIKSDYSETLAGISDITARATELQTVFPLTHRPDPITTLIVRVDDESLNVNTDYTYDPIGNYVKVSHEKSGTPGSEVKIYYAYNKK